MTNPIKNEQCPICASEGKDSSCDNMYTFESGVQYCHVHGTIGKEDIAPIEQNIVVKDGMYTGTYHSLDDRGISIETCKYYGYQINTKKYCHIANFFDASGQVVMQKARFKDKKFDIRGNNQHVNDLYGAWLFNPDNRVFITITEGELDCLSIAEVFNCRYPVVSLPNGAQSAARVLNKNKEYLSQFKYVVLAFDDDEPGRQAIKDCLNILEPGKLRLVKWPHGVKDANDMLKAGRQRELINCVYSAVEYLPEPIITGENLIKKLDNYKTRTQAWPWDTLNRSISPINIPAVYTIAAKPAVGKTLFCSELMRSVINGGGKVGIIALEETIQKVILKMTSALFNKDLLSIQNRELTDEEKDMCRNVANNIVIYDHITYGSDINNICDNIPYMVRSCDCELIIFDNLSYSATGLGSNERKGIDEAMVKLKDSTVKYEYTLLNVCHLKRDDGFEQEITAEAIRGSQGVEMYSDYIIGLDRNKSAEDLTERNTLSIHILKDRMSGNDTGKVVNLFYNKDTGRLEDFGGPFV